MGQPVETARLHLRAWQAHEAQAVFDLLGSDATMGIVRAERVHSIQEAGEWLRKRLAQQQEHGLTMWAVESRDDGVLVGACGLFPQDDRLELAYIIDHRYRRQGYATEAARAAVATGQAARPGCRIYATIRPQNQASVRVAEAVGLRATQTLQDDLGDPAGLRPVGDPRGRPEAPFWWSRAVSAEDRALDHALTSPVHRRSVANGTAVIASPM